MIKTECPWCRQPVLDLSDNPEFVNKNPNNGNSGEKKRSKDSKNNKYPYDKKDHKCRKCREVCKWDWHWCKNCGEYQ